MKFVAITQHISWRDIEQLFREWYRVLKHGGKLILTFPDAAEAMRGYLAESDPVRKLMHWGQILAGSQNGPFMVHMAMLDDVVVGHCLELAGFVNIKHKHVANDHNGPGIYMEAMKK